MVRIHFLGLEDKTLPPSASMEDAMWHLGAKYGAQLHNLGVENRAIVYIPEDQVVRVNVELMVSLENSMP